MQLNLYVCSPFGEYELDMDIDSHSDEGSTLQQRTSWLIKNGPDQVLTEETKLAVMHRGLKCLVGGS